jgi:hypothetical protein
MKMKKIILCSAILILTYCFYSCERDSTRGIANTTSISNTAQSGIKIGANMYESYNYSTNLDASAEESLNKYVAVSFRKDVSNQLLLDLKASYAGDLSLVTENPAMIIIYTSVSNTEISIESAIAISLFTNSGNKLLHRLYILNNSLKTAKEELRLRSYSNAVALKEIGLMANSLENNSNGSFFIGITESNSISNQTVDTKGFGKAVIDYSPQLTTIGGGGGTVKCPSYCTGPRSVALCNASPAGVFCSDGGLCPQGVISTAIIKSGDSNYMTNDQAYSFRDNFMASSTKGRKYIEYYYKLSFVVYEFNTINISTIQSHIILAKELYASANILQNGTDNEIPIPIKTKIDALSMISIYKTYTSNTEYQSILNSIASDINMYAGKTKKEIISSL